VSTPKLIALLAFPAFPDVRVALFEAASPRGQRFAALTAEATAAIVADSAMMADSHRWFRHERSEAMRRMDGLTLATSGVSPLLAAGAALLPAQSAQSEGRFWLEATRDSHLPTASLFGLVLTPRPHDRRSAMLVGSAWQRLHLNATMADALLDDPAWRPGFGFRIGIADAPAGAALRRPVSAVIGPPARLAFEVDQWRAAGGAF
jgi:hypothetical protein